MNKKSTNERQSMLKLYREWANEYLLTFYKNNVDECIEQRFVASIGLDLQDGVLLSYLIDAITNSDLKTEILRKPRNVDEKGFNGSFASSDKRFLSSSTPALFKEVKSGECKMPPKETPQKRETRIPAPRYSSASNLSHKKSSNDLSTKKLSENAAKPGALSAPKIITISVPSVTKNEPRTSLPPKQANNPTVRRSLPPVNDNGNESKNKPPKMKYSSSSNIGAQSNSNTSDNLKHVVNSDLKKTGNEKIAPKRNLRTTGLVPPKIRPNSKSFDKDESGISVVKSKPINSRIILTSSNPKQSNSVPFNKTDTKVKDDDICIDEERKEANVARVSPIRRQVKNNVSHSSTDETRNQVNCVPHKTCDINKDLKVNPPKSNNSLMESPITENESSQSKSEEATKFVKAISNEYKNSQQRHVQLIDDTVYSDSECIKKPKSNFFATGSQTTRNYQLHTIPSIGDIFGKTNQESNLMFDTSPKFTSRKLSTPPPVPTSSLSSYRRLSNFAEFRGSCASLISGSSSNSAAEERQSQEIRKLRNELNAAKERVNNLTQQLNTNVQMVQAFEQSLTSLTSRLQQMTINGEQKDREISRLKNTIQLLRNECEEYSKVSEKNGDHGSKSETLRKVKIVRSASSDREDCSNNNGWFRKVLKKHRSRKDSDVLAEVVSSSLSAPNTPQLTAKSCEHDTEEVKSLKKQLLEKEKLLTDLRLESLTTGNQMEVIKEKMNKMVIELEALKKENSVLQQQIHRRSITSSISSLAGLRDTAEYDNKALLKVGKENIGSLSIQTTTNWEEFNHIIKTKFTQYITSIDPDGSLGLTCADIASYDVGVEKVERRLSRFDPLPELLPFGYLVEESVITIKLKNKLDYLVLQTLVPKLSLEKVINVLKEYRRIIFYGPPGSGKSLFAKCIAHYLVGKVSEYACSADCNATGSVAIINVERNSDQDLSDYLSNVIESDTFSAQLLPNVIVIDSIDNVRDSAKTLSVLNGNNSPQCPFIIGTMTEDTSLISALQLHHGFKAIPYINLVNSMETLLSRCLRKKFLDNDINIASRNSEVSKIVEWIPKVWKRLHDCFQRIKSSIHYSLSIEPFLSCPFHVKESQKWFDNLWNCVIIPWFREVLADGDRSEFDITYRWVMQTYPWPDGKRITSLDSTEIHAFNLSPASLQDSLTTTLIKLKKATDE